VEFKEKLRVSKTLLGIVGGMGVQATACYFDKLHNFQNVTTEQEYIDILLYSIPSIPDRTAYIMQQSSENPLDILVNALQTLESAGVSCITIPCATSHYFYENLVEATNVPIINMLDVTARNVSESGAEKVYLLATDGTISSKIFHSAFDKYGIDVCVPASSVQSRVMEIIYDIKRGTAVSSDVIESLSKQPCEGKKQVTILGCTELCIYAGQSPGVINILDILAQAAIKQMRDL